MGEFARMSTAFVAVVVVVVMECFASTVFAWPLHSGTVSISNEINGNQTILVDCMKGTKNRHIFTPPQTPLASGQQPLAWRFKPDFGRTKYDCDFIWLTHYKRLRMWEDTYWIKIFHWKTRNCTDSVWRVTREGFRRSTSDIKEKTPVWCGAW